jgi:hypothetical protein
MTESPERDPLTDPLTDPTADPDETRPVPSNPPDSLSDPEVDEVRASEPQHGGDAHDETDPMELRSMPPEPNGTDDDPASFINP